MRLLAKIGLLSYGYLMGILWVSYGKGRERAGKSPQNSIFYRVENRDNTFISVYLGICRVYLFFIQTLAYVKNLLYFRPPPLPLRGGTLRKYSRVLRDIRKQSDKF